MIQKKLKVTVLIRCCFDFDLTEERKSERKEKITHMWRMWAHLRISFSHLSINKFFLLFCVIFRPFTPCPLSHPNNPRNQNFKKMKKVSQNVIILNLCSKKTRSNDVCLLRYGVWHIIFCHFKPFFALLPHYWPQKFKFGKNAKNDWRYYPFTHEHHKSRSYDVWFLRCKSAKDKDIFHFGLFFALWPS